MVRRLVCSAHATVLDHPAKSMDGQQVKVRAEIETKGMTRPVRWACHEKTDTDGSLTFRLKKMSDTNWKKGV